MSKNTNLSRRNAIVQLGTLAGGVAAPTLALAKPVDESSDTTNQDGAESAAVETAELERYGIRTYQAPEILLDHWIDENGEATTFSVKEQQGKWLFMKFFQNWCPGCHKLGFPTLQKFVTAFHDHPNVEAIAVQTVFEGEHYNTKEAVRELQLRYELPITMGHDVGTELTQNFPLSMINYRTGGTPWLVLVGPDGQVIMNDFHVDADSLIGFVRKAAG